jgi:hypothetical protein
MERWRHAPGMEKQKYSRNAVLKPNASISAPEIKLTLPQKMAPHMRQRPYWCASVVAALTTVSASVDTGAPAHCDARTTRHAQAKGLALTARYALTTVETM